jgi:hypothetical protein
VKVLKAGKPPIKALTVTNADRLAIAGWLALDWAGPMHVLEAFAELHERLGLKELPVVRDPSGTVIVNAPAGLKVETVRQVVLSENALRVLLQFYPGARTAAAFGPAKVRLLQAVRALLPAPKDDTKDDAPKN